MEFETAIVVIVVQHLTNGEMLKIQRTASRQVVFTLSGRLAADNVGELSTLLAAEPAGRTVVLDLKDVVLVDRDVVRMPDRMFGTSAAWCDVLKSAVRVAARK